MNKEKIKQIKKDIESYRQAIENAECAMAAANQELNELLAEEYYKAESSGEKVPTVYLPDESGNIQAKDTEVLIEMFVNKTKVAVQKVIITGNLPF